MIYLVEDDNSIRELVLYTLNSSGLEAEGFDRPSAFWPAMERQKPELAILGVCDMVDTPVVRNGEIVIRTMMNLSLTADHRVIDGVMASKFLKRVAELLENPYMLLV